MPFVVHTSGDVPRIDRVSAGGFRALSATRTVLDALLVDSGGHSILERRFLEVVRRAGLPRPATQVIHRRDGTTFARVDFLFEAFGVVVEVSGQLGHSTPGDRARDAQRRNELQDVGRAVYEWAGARDPLWSVDRAHFGGRL
jgi:hypothetical protein